jgi:proliferating cell nuclear antigen PCNA
MTILFSARTPDAYRIKILVDLLSNIIKVAHLVIDENGISMRMMDSQRTILIDLGLSANNFHGYKCVSGKQYIGLSLNSFGKMLRSVKKKDAILLFIDDEVTPLRFGVRVSSSKDNTRVTTSYITIQMVQEIDIELPPINNKPIVIMSSDFSKMVKDMNIIGNVVNITSTNEQIKFSSNNGGILERDIVFGEAGPATGEEAVVEHFNDDFSTEQLSKISKISGLNSELKIFPGKPLIMISSAIGNLGEIKLYIKSKSQIDNDNYNNVKTPTENA